MCKIVLLDVVHHLNYNKIIKLQCLKSWVLLLSSGKKGEEDRNLSVGALVELASDLDLV
jgi:hypothetical protein